MNYFFLKLKNLALFILLNKIFHIFLKIVIFITSIYFVYSKINLNTLNINYNYFNFNYLIIVFVLQTLGAYFILLRWKNLLETASSIKYYNKQLLSSIVYSNVSHEFSFISFFLTRLVFVSKIKVKLNQLFSTIIIEKIFSIYSILIIFVIANIIIINFYNYKKFIYLNTIFIYVAFFLIATLIILILININLVKFKSLMEKIFFFKYFISYIDYRNIVKPFYYTFLIQIFSFLILINIPFFLNIELNIFNFLIFLPIVTFVSALPVSFTQWGYRESVFIFFYGLIGIDSNIIFTISITYGILGTLIFMSHVIFYEVSKFLFYKNNNQN